MNQQEWAACCAAINELFAQPLPESKAAALYTFVAVDVDQATMVAAVKRLVAGGQRFMPTAAELVEACKAVSGDTAPADGDVDVPPFSVVLGVLDGCRFLPAERAVQRMTDEAGAVAAAWMCAEGIKSLQAIELNHPDFGAAARRDLERRYLAFAADQRDRARRGLPALEASPTGRLERGGGLRRLAPVEVLPAIGPGDAA